jgi:hypothetical protein
LSADQVTALERWIASKLSGQAVPHEAGGRA